MPKSLLIEWQSALAETNELDDVQLRIYQGTDQSGEMAERLSGEVRAGIIEDLYGKRERLLQNKDERIWF